LEAITESLAKFTQFTKCKPLATLNYASDIYNGSSIVSRYLYFLNLKGSCMQFIVCWVHFLSFSFPSHFWRFVIF